MSVLDPNLAQGQDLFEGAQSFYDHDDRADNKVGGNYSHDAEEFSANEAESWCDMFRWANLHLRSGLLAEDVHNATGGALTAGTLVYVSGVHTNGRRKISKAQHGVNRAEYILLEDIANGADGVAYGFTTELGVTYPSEVRTASLDTSTASAVGSLVYLSGTAGLYTFSDPGSGQVVGRVLVKSATVGEIEFTIGGSMATLFSSVIAHTHAASEIVSGTLAHERGGLEADVSAYDGLPYITGGATSQIKIKLNATAAPTATDDTAAGYRVGSLWVDTTNDKVYQCVDATNSAAVWKETSAGVSAFTGLSDTPGSLGGEGLKLVRVNSGGTALEFITEGSIDHDNLTNFVANEHVNHTSVSIATQYSLDGGGTIASTRTLNLVNDVASPGNSKYYGTNGSGTRGWYDLPAGSGSTTFVGLTDTPSNFTGGGLKLVRVNTGETALEYVAASALDHDAFTNFVANEHIDHTAVSISTQHSLTGGGTIASTRTLSLVGDTASPGNSKYYGTDGSGTRGWYDLPAGSGSTTFVGLTDTPSSFSGAGGKRVRVNSGATALEFVDKDIIGIPFLIGGSSISTGVQPGDIRIPFAGTIKKVTLLANVSGSITVDLWKDTYANYPPTVADTITAAAKPTISSATKSENSTLTGWTTSVTAGDIIRVNVDSVTTITYCTLIIDIERS